MPVEEAQAERMLGCYEHTSHTPTLPRTVRYGTTERCGGGAVPTVGAELVAQTTFWYELAHDVEPPPQENTG